MSHSRPRFIYFSATQQVIFFRRLSLYLRSGIPITRALTFITLDSDSHSASYILNYVEETVAMGLPFSQGLAAFPSQFSAFSIGFVRAGERSGRLSETLAYIAGAIAKQHTLRKKILSALLYPALIFSGVIGITLFLTLFIFPKILPIFKGFHTTLPFTTRMLIGLNAFLSHEWLMCVFGSCLFLTICIVGMRFKKTQEITECVLLRMPIFSSLYTEYAIATFARTLSLQLRGGIHILSALELTRTTLPGALYPGAISALEESLAQGQRFSSALQQHERLFPRLVSQMIAAGEMTGTLGINLESIADQYEENLDERTKNLAVLIEPVLMTCMGFVVGFVALAIITPVYSITQNLSGS